MTMILTHLRVLKVVKNRQKRRNPLKRVKKITEILKMMKRLKFRNHEDQRKLFYLRKMIRMSCQKSYNLDN